MKTTLFNDIANYDNEIQTLRTQINLIDDKIVELLKERLTLVYQVREIKKIEGMPFFCPNREEVILANATTNTKGLEKEYIQDIYKTLIEATRKVADQKFSN